MEKLVWMPLKTKDFDSQFLAARLQDLSRRCQRTRRQVDSLFLTEAQLQQAKQILGKQCLYRVDGGYPDAQRCRIAFLYEEEDYQSSVVCLCAKINQKFVKLTHRDVLGALMGLSLERSQFGDLFVLENQIVVYCTDTIANEVMTNCRQIHRLSLAFEKSEEVFENLQQYQQRTINVASLRLDNVVGALVPCSRKQAAMLIKTQKVSINHEIIEDCDKLCHNRDTVSISGIGRFILVDEGRTSRKERHILEVKKYL